MEKASEARIRVSQTDQIALFRYVTAGERTPYYRRIMRFLLERHEQHQYQLSLDEIRDHILTWEASYTPELVVADLDYLENNGNLMSDFMASGLNTIASFKNRRRTYQATNHGLEIERFLRDLESRTRGTGALNVSTLQSLWDHLGRLEESAMAGDAGRTDQNWYELFHTFRQFHTAANDYFSDMESARRQRLFDHESFLIYRDALWQYLTEFAQGLYYFGPLFRDRLRRWNETGWVQQVEALLLEADLQGNPFDPPDETTVRDRFRSQWGGLYQWFADGGSADRIHQQAMKAIELVSSQARRLMEMALSTAAKHRELEQIARHFAQCRSLTQSARLATLVYGHESGRQWEGDGAMLPAETEGLPWRQQPVTVDLMPITRGPHERRSRQGALIEDRTLLSLMRAVQREEERKVAAGRLDLIFGPDDVVEFTDLAIPSADDAQLIIRLLSACLARSNKIRETTAPDGSMVRLENPRAYQDGAPLGEVRTIFGTLSCPAFRLRRIRPGRG